MDIRGLLLATSEHSGAADAAPLATLDVAGKSALQRMAERLQQYGISQVSAVVEDVPSADLRNFVLPSNFGLPSDVSCISATADRFWRTAENAFNEMAQSGAELVVLVRLALMLKLILKSLCSFISIAAAASRNWRPAGRSLKFSASALLAETMRHPCSARSLRTAALSVLSMKMRAI